MWFWVMIAAINLVALWGIGAELAKIYSALVGIAAELHAARRGR